MKLVKKMTFNIRALAEKHFKELAKTSTSKVGITREAFGQGEEAAFKVVRAFVEKFDLEAEIDASANLVITLPGKDLEKPFIVCGSHLDSVPQGGNYDGAAGVVAGIICLARMRHEGFIPRQNIKVVAFRGEESAWFGKPYIGSSAWFGKLSGNDLNAISRNARGKLADALKRSGADINRIANGEQIVNPDSIAAYIELHIEQGPVMIARDLPTAIVTGIRGAIRHQRVSCIGHAGHSGAVPRWLRNDALFATAELISTLDEHWRILQERGLDIVFTIGMIETDPDAHAITRIPGEVFFSFEIRSQSIDALESFYYLMRRECQQIEKERGVKFQFDRRLMTSPARISEAWIKHLITLSERLNLVAEKLPSGAGHDAAVFANVGIPTAMIFVRNKNGSHNPSEAMDMDDFLMGAELLFLALKEAL